MESFVCLFVFFKESDSAWVGWGGAEGEQVPCLVQSQTQDSNSGPWDHDPTHH